jgi:hypothetical protein
VALKWRRYGIEAADIEGGNAISMDSLHHVAHVDDAADIAADRIMRVNLVRDESRLNRTRICVAWTSPNTWYHGSIYGNVRFTMPVNSLLVGRNFYKVEVMRSYSPPAVRVLVSESDWDDHPLLDPFDPADIGNPLHVDEAGVWWRLDEYNYEIMFDRDISLDACTTIGFVDHHARVCSARRGCRDKGVEKKHAAGHFIAMLLASEDETACDLLIEPELGTLDMYAGWGLRDLRRWIARPQKKPRAKEKYVAGLLRAGLRAYGEGDAATARACFSSIGSRKAALRAFDNLVEELLGEEVLNQIK